MTRFVEVQTLDSASDTGQIVMSVNPDNVLWVSDHPELPGRGLMRMVDDAVITAGDRAHVVALLERGPRR